MQTKQNIAARAGRWSAQHRKAAIIGWLVFVVLAFGGAGSIGVKQLGDTQTSRTGESGRADSVLRSTFKRNYAEDVFVQARKGATPSEVRSGVRDVVQRIRATGAATNIRSPLAQGNSGQLAKDGRAAVVTFEVKRTAGDSQGTKICASTSSATPASGRRWTSRSPTTSRRPPSCRCRSPSRSSSSRSARWPRRAFRCCSRSALSWPRWA